RSGCLRLLFVLLLPHKVSCFAGAALYLYRRRAPQSPRYPKRRAQVSPLLPGLSKMQAIPEPTVAPKRIGNPIETDKITALRLSLHPQNTHSMPVTILPISLF